MSIVIYRNAISEILAEKCLEEIEIKKNHPVWISSSCFWSSGIKRNVIGSCIQCDVSPELQNEIFDEVKKYLPEGYTRLSYQFYIWQHNAAISNHSDYGYHFGGTIYLSRTWDPDWGGIFLWNDYDEESKHYVDGWRANIPEYRCLTINSSQRDHLVTPVSPTSPQFRYTIQFWGHND